MLVLLGVSNVGIIRVGFVGAATEIETTAHISVPSTFETGQAVNVHMWIEPSPPTVTDRFHNVALIITNPEGSRNEYTPVAWENGTFYWSYMINKLGSYSFQFSFQGETFEDNSVTYKPSKSVFVTLMSVGDQTPPVEKDGGSWSQKHSLSQARAGLGVAAVNGKIYAIGGSTENGSYVPSYQTTGIVGTNEEYDPASDLWTVKKSMPTPRANFAVAVVQNKIYCINAALTGFKLDETYHLFQVPVWSGVNEVYDPATDTWETKTPMPVGASYARANVVNDKIYVMNGDDNWMYDPKTDSWSTKTSPSISYGGYPTTYPSAVVGDKIYFLSNHLPIQIYDTTNDNWSLGERCPRLDPQGIACATIGSFAPERIYFFTLAQYGWVPYGETGTSGFERKTTFIYNPQTDSWSAGAVIPNYRVNFGVAVLNDKVYMVGGYVWKDHTSNNVTVCDLNDQYTPVGYGQVKPSDSSLNEYVDQQTLVPSEPVNDNLSVVIFGGSTAAIVCLGLSLLWYFKRSRYR